MSPNVIANARNLAGVFLLALLGGCALFIPQTSQLHEAWPEGLPRRAELTSVPFFPQAEYQCGPAALATVLAHAGADVTAASLVSEVYLPGRRGSLQVEMLATPRRHDRISYQLAPRFEDLLKEVASGVPVVVLQDYGVWPVRIWHYAVVVGYDQAGEVVLRSGTKPRLTMPLAILEYTWKESGYWAMVAMPPDRIPATATEDAYVAAVAAAARVGTPQAARIAYSAVLRRWPGNLAAGIGEANADHALGDLAHAEAVLRSLVKRHPASAAVLNNLAQTLSDRGNHEEALAVIERAMVNPGPLSNAVSETRETIRRRAGNRP